MYDRVSLLARIGVWECDLATEELIWTDMVYDIFGIARGAAISREAVLELYEPESRRQLEQLRSKAIETGAGFTLDIQIHTQAMEVRWVRVTAEIEQEAGRAIRIFGTKQDITSEKAERDKQQSLQTNLIHLSRASAMGAMASTIAHELNQPLTAASMYLSAARRLASETTPDLDECINGALAATFRADEIIRSVRAMSRKGDSKKVEVQLEPVLKEAANLATVGIAALSVSCDIAPDLTVFVDPVQIQQVLINLVRNAGEAADSAGCHIRIAASATHSSVDVCVVDDGPGIPQDILAAAFDPFVSTKSEGLGVGLSISRTIVEAHGGQIRAENLPGGGASVCFTLPRRSLQGVIGSKSQSIKL